MSGFAFLERTKAAQALVSLGGQERPPTTVVVAPNAGILESQVSESFVTAEQLYRKLPEPSFYSPAVSPQQPIQFEIGAYEVPTGSALWLFDYQFRVFVFSGVDPGDMVEAAPGRFSRIMGFDLTVSGTRPGSVKYELDPSAITVERFAFLGGGGATPGQFARDAANSFAANASAGTSLLPVWTKVQGARTTPFMTVVDEQLRVALSCVIFRQVTSPVAAVEGRIAGYLVDIGLSSELVNKLSKV